MQTMNTNHPQDAFEQWFKAFSLGLNANGTPLEKEAALHRRLLQERSSELQNLETPFTAERVARGWQQFQAKLSLLSASNQTENVTKPVALDTVNAKPQSKWFNVIASNQSSYALAAGIAALTIGMLAMQQTQESQDDQSGEVIMRGESFTQEIRLTAAESDLLVSKVEAVFSKNQIIYLKRDITGGVQLQAKVAANSAAAKELDALGVKVPEHGRLNILLVIGK